MHDGWHLEVIEGIRNGDWARLRAGLSMPGADVNATMEYERGVPKNERVFRFGPVQLTLFDSITDLDAIATTVSGPADLAANLAGLMRVH